MTQVRQRGVDSIRAPVTTPTGQQKGFVQLTLTWRGAVPQVSGGRRGKEPGSAALHVSCRPEQHAPRMPSTSSLTPAPLLLP